MAWSALTLAAALRSAASALSTVCCDTEPTGSSLWYRLGGDAVVDISGLILRQNREVVVQLCLVIGRVDLKQQLPLPDLTAFRIGALEKQAGNPRGDIGTVIGRQPSNQLPRKRCTLRLSLYHGDLRERRGWLAFMATGDSHQNEA